MQLAHAAEALAWRVTHLPVLTCSCQDASQLLKPVNVSLLPTIQNHALNL
jgi:hypothetical protein